MLDTMFKQSLSQFNKPTFLGAGDRLIIKTFDNTVNEFEKEIDVKSPNSWAEVFERLREGGHRQFKIVTNDKGQRVRDRASPLFKTNLPALFNDIKNEAELAKDDDRQKIVLIASDFINDLKNLSKPICDEAESLSRGNTSSTYDDLLSFSNDIDQLRRGISPIYFGFLEVTAKASGNSAYSNCLRKLLPLRPVTTQLETQLEEGEIIGDVIQFKPNQKDLGEFAADLMEKIVTATLPPAIIKKADLEVGGEPQTLTISLNNAGLKPLNIVGLDYYDGTGENASLLHQTTLGSIVVIGKGETKPVISVAPVNVVDRARNGESIYVSVRDSSPKTGNLIASEEIEITDISGIDIEKVVVDKDRLGIEITAVVRRGAPKRPQSLVILSDGKKSEYTLPLDLEAGPLKFDDGARVLPKTNLNNQISNLSWDNKVELAIRDNNGRLSDYYTITPPPLEKGPPLITSARWIQVTGKPGTWAIEVEITNPPGNPKTTSLTKVLLAGTNGMVITDCSVTAKKMEKGPFKVKSVCNKEYTSINGFGQQLLTEESIFLELVPEELEKINKDQAYELTRPEIIPLIIDKEKTYINSDDDVAKLIVSVRNSGWFLNRVQAIEIAMLEGGNRKVFSSEVRGREKSIIKGQLSEVYLPFDSDGVSEFLRQGKPFEVRVQDLSGDFSSAVKIESLSEKPLRIRAGENYQKWSSEQAQLELTLINESGYVQKNPLFNLYSSKNSFEPIFRDIEPIERILVGKAGESNVKISFASDKFTFLFTNEESPFFICVSKSDPQLGSEGCIENYRVEIKPPSKFSGRIGGVTVEPISAPGEKFSDGKFLQLDLTNNDPYPITIDQLRIKNPRTNEENDSDLTEPFTIPANSSLEGRRVQFKSDTIWDKFNPDSVRIAVNDFPFGKSVSFDPVNVKITDALIQLLPKKDSSITDLYRARVDLVLTNTARQKQRRNSIIEARILQNGVSVGFPEKAEIFMNASDVKFQQTVYFDVEFLKDVNYETFLKSLKAEARIVGREEAADSISVIEAPFDWYAFSWKVSGPLFLFLTGVIILFYKKTLIYFWSRMLDWPDDKWNNIFKFLIENIYYIYTGIIAIITTTGFSFYYWYNDIDPLGTSPLRIEETQPFFPLWLPTFVLILLGLLAFQKINQRKLIKKINHKLISNNSPRMPITRMRPQRFKPLMISGVLGIFFALVIYAFIFAPLNSGFKHLKFWNWLNFTNNSQTQSSSELKSTSVNSNILSRGE